MAIRALGRAGRGAADPGQLVTHLADRGLEVAASEPPCFLDEFLRCAANDHGTWLAMSSRYRKRLADLLPGRGIRRAIAELTVPILLVH